MSSAKDTRYLVTYGYARLVGYDAQYKLVPNILESFDVEDGRIFTFHLRPGQKWSDGSPFTTEDFRYLLGGCRQQSRALAGRPARAMLVRRRAAEGRGHRRDDDPLQLVQAQSRFPAGAGAAARSLHLFAPATI